MKISVSELPARFVRGVFCIVDKNAGKHHNRSRKDERKLGWQEKREEDGAACTYSG